MDIVLRATAMFAILFLLLRLLGKRELGQMTPFEVVTLVVFGDLIQQGVTHNDFSITGATLAIFTFAFWSMFVGWLTFRWPALRKWTEDEPRIVVRDGKVLWRNLRQDRVTIDELHTEMRLAGIGSLDEVAWAILEPNGKVSFLGRGKDTAQSDDSADGAA